MLFIDSDINMSRAAAVFVCEWANGKHVKFKIYQLNVTLFELPFKKKP